MFLHGIGQVGRDDTLATADRAPGVTTTVTIPAASSDLFALVTNARQWPRWHPASASVHETPDRPLVHGLSVVGSVRAASRSVAARWDLVECDALRPWVIATDSPQGCAWIKFTLRPEHAGTRFARRLKWRSHSAFWAWCGRWLKRCTLARQSPLALTNLVSLFRAQDATP